MKYFLIFSSLQNIFILVLSLSLSLSLSLFSSPSLSLHLSLSPCLPLPLSLPPLSLPSLSLFVSLSLCLETFPRKVKGTDWCSLTLDEAAVSGVKPWFYCTFLLNTFPRTHTVRNQNYFLLWMALTPNFDATRDLRYDQARLNVMQWMDGKRFKFAPAIQMQVAHSSETFLWTKSNEFQRNQWALHRHQCNVINSATKLFQKIDSNWRQK